MDSWLGLTAGALRRPCLMRFAQNLSTIMGTFTAMSIMHRSTTKRDTVFGRRFASGGEGTTISPAIVEIVIDVPVEMFRPVIPWPCSDEYPAWEPLRPVVTIRSAGIRRYLIVSIRTNGRTNAYSYSECNMAPAASGHEHSTTNRCYANRHDAKLSQRLHCAYTKVLELFSLQ